MQVDRLSLQLQKLEKDLEAARNAESSARAEAASEAKRRALQTAEAEAAGANARSEHAQALSTLQASVKKLEVLPAYLALCEYCYLQSWLQWRLPKVVKCLQLLKSDVITGVVGP